MIVDESYPMLRNTPTIDPINFVCPMPHVIFPTNATATGVTIICRVSYGAGGLEEPLGSSRTESFLVLDFIYGDMLNFAANRSNRTTSSESRTDGLWSIVADGRGVDLLRATTCYITLFSNLLTVEMTSSRDGPEPKMVWNRTLGSYDTTGSQHQLRVSLDPSPAEEHGLLDLNQRENWQDVTGLLVGPLPSYTYLYDDDSFIAMSVELELNIKPLNNFNQSNGFVVLSNITLDLDSAHESHSELFQHTLQATKSPALALQAVSTRICQMIHYDALPRGAVSGIGQGNNCFFFERVDSRTVGWVHWGHGHRRSPSRRHNHRRRSLCPAYR